MLLKNSQLETTSLLFGAPVGVTALEFRRDFGVRKLESLGYRVALFA